MIQIHQIQKTIVRHHVLDPQRGTVIKTEEVWKEGEAQSLTFANADADEKYKINDDLTFSVSDEAAAYLLKQDGWYAGPNPFYVAPSKPTKATKS